MTVCLDTNVFLQIFGRRQPQLRAMAQLGAQAASTKATETRRRKGSKIS